MKVIEWLGNTVRFIDQTKLPLEESYISTNDYRVVAEGIRTLRLRGAPLIGISAAYGAALAAINISTPELTEFRKQLGIALLELAATRPTAINLRWALDRILRVSEESDSIESARASIIQAAIEIHTDDIRRCEQIGKHGAVLIHGKMNVLTHCNTGALATGGEGTALSVIKMACKNGNIGDIFLDETRPLLQGARLSAWELSKEGIPCTVITDSMAAAVMRQKKVDFVIVGADRIAANGDTANKIGTYSLAVLARYHGIPFYIAAPTSTIDPMIPTGDQIPIEERSPHEITHILGKRVVPERVHVYNPAFDVTPASLITAIITDESVCHPPYEFSRLR